MRNHLNKIDNQNNICDLLLNNAHQKLNEVQENEKTLTVVGLSCKSKISSIHINRLIKSRFLWIIYLSIKNN
ncbi:MAG: hypothetical protein ACTHJ2_02675, partial [Candidatus Nitrosocosmicus sp.]